MSEPVEVQEWVKESLPEALHDLPFLKDADSPDAFKQRIVDAAQYMGRSVKAPGQDATPEERQQFREKMLQHDDGLIPLPDMDDAEQMAGIYKRLGMPEAADEYKTPDGIDLPPEQLGQVKGFAIKANMTQKQFETYLSEWNEAYQAQIHTMTEQQAEALSALKGEWGAAFEQKSGEAVAFLEASGLAQFAEAAKNGQLPADQLRAFAAMSEAVAPEDGEFQRQDPNRETAMTPAEAEDQLAAIRDKLYARDTPYEEKQRLNAKRIKLLEAIEAGRQ